MKTSEPKWNDVRPWCVTISDHLPGMERYGLVIVMSPVHSVAMVTLCRERTLQGHWGLHWNVHWEGELCDAFNAVPELRMRMRWPPGQVMAWSGLHLYPEQNKEWMESPLWHHPCYLSSCDTLYTLWPCNPCVVCDTLAGLTLQLASHSRQMGGWTTLSLSGLGSRAAVASFHDPAWDLRRIFTTNIFMNPVQYS